VLCWVALDRGVQLAEARDDRDRAERWRKVADEIEAEVCARGVDDRGVFMQRYDADALDASLLLLPLMGFLPAEDARVRATVLAIADELTEDGLVLRYRVDETDDGLSGEEGTFTICSFWLVTALAQIGEIERARRYASDSCRSRARWGCTPRRSTPRPAAISATSRRRSATCR
jgi:alpha,alpha-trehalase